MQKFDSRLRRTLASGRKRLEIGELFYYGDVRRDSGTPYRYKRVDFFDQAGLVVVNWPFEEQPDEAVASQTCELLGAEAIWFVTEGRQLIKFQFVRSVLQIA